MGANFRQEIFLVFLLWFQTDICKGQEDYLNFIRGKGPKSVQAIGFENKPPADEPYNSFGNAVPPYFGGLPYPLQVPQQQQPYYQQPQPELINLRSQSPYTSPCATVLTTSNCVLQVPDDGFHTDIQPRNYMFAAAIIRDHCSLTTKDCAGTYSTASNYLISPISLCATVASVCCECHGCNRNFPLYENSCAILFENAKCSICHGFHFEVANNDRIPAMNPLVDNKISSLLVVPGCDMYVYSEPNFQGSGAIARGSIDELPMEWNDAISSYHCNCSSGDFLTTLPPPQSTTQPPQPTTTQPPPQPTTTQSPPPSTTQPPSTTLSPTTQASTTPTSSPVNTTSPRTTNVETETPPTAEITQSPSTTTPAPPDSTTDEFLIY